MGLLFELDAHAYVAKPLYREDGFDLDVDGEPMRVSLAPVGGGEYELRCDGLSERIFVARNGDRVFVHLRGQVFEICAVDALERVRREARARQGGGALCAPMPGVVVEVRVALGDLVDGGDILLVIESMKLQTAIQAESRGRVVDLPVPVGQGFRRGDVLARLERSDDGESPA